MIALRNPGTSSATRPYFLSRLPERLRDRHEAADERLMADGAQRRAAANISCVLMTSGKGSLARAGGANDRTTSMNEVQKAARYMVTA